ncbi:MAG: hypothetical protein IT449_14965 [Phycisphaerales bacterium]|nr:hypothetical protein [Phycisphaerales bacterium]
MAKQAVGTIERHLEKGILGVAVLVLFAAVAKFLIISPNKIELTGADTVTPGTVDDKVAEGAEAVRRTIAAAKPVQKPVESAAPEFEKRLDPYQFASLPIDLPRGVAFQPPVPVFSTVVAVNVELVKPLPLPKPVLAAGRSCLAFEEVFDWMPGMDEGQLALDTDKDYSQPVSWVTVSSLWDRAAQVKENEKAYAKGKQFALAGGMEIQRRVMRPDGSWSEEDWQTIKPYDRAAIREPSEVPLEKDRDGKLKETAESIQAASQLFNLILDPVVQMNLLRPIAPAPACGDMWTYPSIPGSDVLMQDDEYHWPEVSADYKPSKSLMKDRYPRSAEEMEKLDKPWENGRKITREDLLGSDWRAMLKAAEKTFMEAVAAKDKTLEANAYNFVALVLLNGPTVDQAIAPEAEKVIKRMEAASPVGPGPKPPGGKPPGGKLQVEKETQFVAHEPHPTQQVWAIDGQPGSLVGGQTYQYRIRAKVFNPYYGQPQSLKNPEDAKIAFVTGEWSEPSDPIYVEPDTQYFARSTSKDKDAEHVTFEMYKWYDGLWVKGTFKLGIGDLVGGESRVQIAEDEKPSIPFDAAALVLDVNFDRPWCGRGKSGKEGIRFSETKAAESIVLVDAAGNISERILDIDKATPKQKEIAAKQFVYKPPKKEENPNAPLGQQPPGRGGAGERGTGSRGGSALGGMGYGGAHGGGGEGGGERDQPKPRP